MRNLRQRTVSGLWWSGATQGLGQGLQFAISVVLARLLSPSEFGLVGMIVVFTGFAASLMELGLGAAIVQMHAPSARHLNAAFWLNVGIGAALTLLLAVCAPWIADFYGEPQLRVLTVGVALTFLLGSLNVVQNALLEKNLNFRARFRIEVVSVTIAGAVALTLAFRGAGAWALVGQAASLAAARAAVMWYGSPWRPGLAVDRGAIRDLLRFARHVMGFNAVIYWGQHFDKLAIGRWVGHSALGIYNLADRLMRLSLNNVTGITGSVMFPALSALHHDVESVRRVYLRANRMIALVTFPMMIGLCVLAEPAILTIYGDAWRDAIPIVQLLSLAGMAQSVYNTAAWIFMSRGRPDVLFRLGVYATSVRIAGVLIGIRWGLVGVACAYVIGSYFLILTPTWMAAGRLIGVRILQLIGNVSGPLLCAAGMGALVRWSYPVTLLGQPQWLRLLVHVVAGAVIYGLSVIGFRLRAWGDLREVLAESGIGRRQTG